MSIKKLRSVTGMPVVMCASAWKASGENWDSSIEILKQKGMDKSVSLDSRDAETVFVGVYVHHDGRRAGVVKMCCETDFVANTPEFREMANGIAMHICVTDTMDNLSDQLFVIGEKETIGSMIKTFSAKTGEKITISSTFKV